MFHDAYSATASQPASSGRRSTGNKAALSTFVILVTAQSWSEYKQCDCLYFGSLKRTLSRKRHLPLESMDCKRCRIDCLYEVTLAPIGGWESVTFDVTFRVTVHADYRRLDGDRCRGLVVDDGLTLNG